MNLIQQLFANWRTTSSGILGIATSIYIIIHTKGMDQALFGVLATNILNSLGLIFSRDSQASAVDKASSNAKIADLQNQVAQVKGDSAQMNKP